MGNLAEYVMRGRKQAVLLALLFAVLPLLGWVADVIVALVTLRKGAKEGAIILLWMLLPSVVLALMSQPALWLYDIVGGSIVTYGLALLLRSIRCWSITLEISLLLGIAVVALVHGWVDDVPAMWSKSLSPYLQVLSQRLDSPAKGAEIQKGIALFIPFATGFQVAIVLLGDLFNLLIARWWQAILYNPGALRQELLNIRCGRVTGLIGLIVIIGSVSGSSVLMDSLPIVLLIFALAGVSLVHSFIAHTKSRLLLVIVFYVALIGLFPYIALILAILAWFDAWLDFRGRINFFKNSSD